MRNYVNMGERVAFLIIQDGGYTVEVLTSGLNDENGRSAENLTLDVKLILEYYDIMNMGG